MSEQTTTEPTAFSHAAPWLHLRPGMRVVAFKDPEDFSVNGELISVGVEGCAVRNLEEGAAPDDIFFATWSSGITFYPEGEDFRHATPPDAGGDPYYRAAALLMEANALCEQGADELRFTPREDHDAGSPFEAELNKLFDRVMKHSADLLLNRGYAKAKGGAA